MPRSPHTLIDYLPAIYQSDPFLSRFLRAFDEILLGGNPDQLGLEETIADIARYFDPQQTPASADPDQDFLSWLSNWTALSLRADLTEGQQRNFIAQIIPLYQRRGTKENLIQLLKIFTFGEPEVSEAGAAFQVGKSRVGIDTYLGGGPPHFFTVRLALVLSQIDPLFVGRQMAIAKALIDLEKPAHTHYQLTIVPYGGMQVGKVSTIGIDTLIGTIPNT